MLALSASSEIVCENPRNVFSRPLAARHDEMSAPLTEQFAQSSPSVYAAREDLFLEGDEASHILEIVEGVVCAYRLLPDGHRHVVSFYFAGDLIGYCSQPTHTFSAQALTKVRTRRIPRQMLNQLIETRPHFARRLLKLAADELTMTREHMLCLAAKSAEARMAVFLLALSRRNRDTGADPARIELPMTRVDIGDYLGLTIETVSRTFSKLKRAGVIALPRTTTVQIRDAAELEALAQG
ncbi:MAG: helix-turn-helix domain-containing protein [Hyphomicrobiaceae bacterium]